jgi:hypothetical protein
MIEEIYIVANGDYRQECAVACWPKILETIGEVKKAFEGLGISVISGNPFKPELSHGFITTQAEGCKVFENIPRDAAVVLVFASWAWAHHVAGPLKLHQGPVLLIANFDGTWPGLVSLLNHSATFDRLGIDHAKLWSEEFTEDAIFMGLLKTWLTKERIEYSTSHLHPAETLPASRESEALGKLLAEEIVQSKRILGQFDPGCMGMLNAVIDPAKLASIGMPVEYLSQSDLLAEMDLVTDEDAEACLSWIENAGAAIKLGKDPETELTREQLTTQMKMYIAAVRFYERYGLSAIGIPYQYGLVRSVPASDLVEGMLNNSDRPPVMSKKYGTAIGAKEPIIHFNEGDAGSAVPQILMKDILREKGMAMATTLHDVRWGDYWKDRFIWVFEISGGAPPEHFGGWENASIYRQTKMDFPLGGGTCSGVSKPGGITWARFYERYGEIGMECGAGEVLELPEKEVYRRLQKTTSVWPIANVWLPGYGRDELMSTHKANHITICYGNVVQELIIICRELGIPVWYAGSLDYYHSELYANKVK